MIRSTRCALGERRGFYVPSASFRRQGAEGGWGDAAFRGGFVGGGDTQYDVFLAGLGAEDQGERQAWGRQGGLGIGGDRNITRGVGAEGEDRVVDGRDVTRRDQDFGQAGVGAVEGFRAQIVAAAERVVRAADLGRRQRRVQAHERVEAVFEQHHHVEPA